MVDEKTHKCGVSNLIDVDLAELKRIYERLNLHTASSASGAMNNLERCEFIVCFRL